MKQFCLLNTRPEGQNKELSAIIRHAGGESIELPTLEIKPTDLDWTKNLPCLLTLQLAIFISKNAVNYFFQGLKASNINWPNSIKNIAIGKSSAQALIELGLNVEQIPDVFDSEHLLNLELLQDVANLPIMLVKGEEGRTLIAETLIKRGAIIKPVSVYARGLPKINQEYIDSLWRSDSIDIILLTSQQSMLNLFSLLDFPGKTWLKRKPCIVISARLAEEAKKLGIKNIITYNYDFLLQRFKDLAHDNQ